MLIKGDCYLEAVSRNVEACSSVSRSPVWIDACDAHLTNVHHVVLHGGESIGPKYTQVNQDNTN